MRASSEKDLNIWEPNERLKFFNLMSTYNLQRTTKQPFNALLNGRFGKIELIIQLPLFYNLQTKLSNF